MAGRIGVGHSARINLGTTIYEQLFDVVVLLAAAAISVLALVLRPGSLGWILLVLCAALSVGVFTSILLTRCEQITEQQQQAILDQLVKLSPSSWRFRARFIHRGFRHASSASQPPDINLDAAKGRPIFLVAGIANPMPLHDALKAVGADIRGHWWLPDHHDYTPSDLHELHRRAHQSGANAIITTEKDWIKIISLPGAINDSLPIWRLDLDVQIDPTGKFEETFDETALWAVLSTGLRGRIHRPQQDRPPQPHESSKDQNPHHHPNPRP
jgi:hypothetical protein